MIVGYIRMCTQAEDRDREKALHQWGAEKLYWEKDSSRSWVRPAYEEMAATLQPGDTVVVSEFRQLAGSARDVLILLHRLRQDRCFRNGQGPTIECDLRLLLQTLPDSVHIVPCLSLIHI